MRVFVAVFLGLVLSAAAAAAADLKIKVVDPQSATVAGAQVSLVCPGEESKVLLATRNTAADGTLTLITPAGRPCQLRVLAPGFAAETIEVSSQGEITVRLHLAIAAETVVVSATRTPVPGEAAGADVDTVPGAQLTTPRPNTATRARERRHG